MKTTGFYRGFERLGSTRAAFETCDFLNRRCAPEVEESLLIAQGQCVAIRRKRHRIEDRALAGERKQSPQAASGRFNAAPR
jgi:hypothetical protein